MNTAELLKFCLTYRANDRFLNSVNDYFYSHGYLTHKQMEVLKKIAGEINNNLMLKSIEFVKEC